MGFFEVCVPTSRMLGRTGSFVLTTLMCDVYHETDASHASVGHGPSFFCSCRTLRPGVSNQAARCMRSECHFAVITCRRCTSLPFWLVISLRSSPSAQRGRICLMWGASSVSLIDAIDVDRDSKSRIEAA